jgi:hypothetical protein
MTLMKSILLGSAAGIVAVAGAQAADLPTRKAAPAEYVKICNVGGMAGFIIPGSDTCLKIGGYITGQIEAGNTGTSYAQGASVFLIGAPPGARDGATLTSLPGNLVPSFGFTTRLNLSLDARSNTAYGVLRGYAEMQFDDGSGFDNTGGAGYINLAYVQWAGITAGRAPSFFSFFGGGEGWANLLGPDMQGFNQPDVLAYTATFGGGFSATIAIQNNAGVNGAGTNFNQDTTNYGESVPDIVANLRLDQSWGSAQVSGVAHNVHVFVTGSTFGPGAVVQSQNIWGWGVDAGVKFNLPSFGPGDNVQIQGAYSKNAIIYSGIVEGLWGELDAAGPGGRTGPNGSGLATAIGDTYFAGFNATGAPVWSTPTAWTIGATFEHHFGTTFSIDPEVSYGELNWSGQGGIGTAGELSSNMTTWVAGAAAHWDPVTNLDFEVELLYQNIHQSTPGNWTNAAGANVGTINGVVSAFPANSSGFAGRFEVTRNF